MATPYFQLRFDTVPSTQDIARDRVEDLPVLVLAAAQTAGRGRSGAPWETADRALAASLAFRTPEDDRRPFSLIAGVAATRATEATTLKWPNDVLVAESKVGGILVERSGDVVVVGLGLNLWWEEPPAGMSALYDEDPGEERHAEVGALWGAELMRALEPGDWPLEEYRGKCVTIGQDITWQPDGAGRATGVTSDGGLVVETRDGASETIYSGTVRHVR